LPAADALSLQPRWYPLTSKKPDSKKDSYVTGAIQLEFSLLDKSASSADSQTLLQKLTTLVGSSQSDLLEEDEMQEDEEDLDQSESITPPDQETGGDADKKKRRRLRIAKLKRKVKERGYEFSNNGSAVAGVLFIEIQKCTDLPPERNATRTGFDMDPFVVITLGRKTYRTRVIRHNLNPIYDEKLVFQVQKNECNFSLGFSVVDRDNFSGNDYVGRCDLPLDKIIALAPEADPSTGLFVLPEWPDGMATPTPETKKSRFKLSLSRSSSSQSLSKLASRPVVQKEPSSASLHPDDVALSSSIPTSNPMEAQMSDSTKTLRNETADDGLRPFVLPLALKNNDTWEGRSPALYIRAK